MEFFDTIHKTFWKPQNIAMNAFEDHTGQVRSDYPVTIDPNISKPMRLIMTCGCGKSRCLNCISLKFQRSCGLFSSIPLIYQFLNKEIYGGLLNIEPDNELHPNWIDEERKVLVICSKKAKSLNNLTKEQQDALLSQNVSYNNLRMKFTVTTNEDEIYKFLKKIIRKKKKCIILSTYRSAHRLRNVTDRLIKENILSNDETLFGVTFYDEAHSIFSDSGKKDYLYKYNGKLKSTPNDSIWDCLNYWGYRIFATATQSKRMLKQKDFLGKEIINYSLGEGVRDGIVRDYDLYIRLYQDPELVKQSRLERHLRMAARAMKDCDRKRVLCFHHYTNENEKKGTSAISAASSENHKIISEELGVSSDKVWIKAVSGDMSEEKRMEIFNEFQSSPEDGIFRILVNCKVIGTGIDLKCIDMVAFIDPRKSPSMVTQNILRGTRRNNYDKRNLSVMLPVMVERDKLLSETKEGRCNEIRKSLKNSCFEQLAEFLYCLKQHDTRWEDILVSSPSKSENLDNDKARKISENSEKKKKEEQKSIKISERIKVIVDSTINWDIDLDQLKEMTIETIKLIGEKITDPIEKSADGPVNFVINNYRSGPPKRSDITQIPDFKDSVGYFYAKTKDAKKTGCKNGIYAEAVKIFEESDYSYWHEYDWSKDRSAKLAVDFIIKTYNKRPPGSLDKTIIPGYNYKGKKTTVGNFFQGAKKSKKGKDSKNGIYAKAAKLFDDSGYIYWNDTEIAKIPVNFIIQTYIDAPPITSDKTKIPNYNLGESSVGHFYSHTLAAKRSGKETGIHSKAAKLFDESNYKYWHGNDWTENKDKNLSDKEKAKIPFKFIVENYITCEPKNNDKTHIPGYKKGTFPVGNFYSSVKNAKIKGNPKGIYSEVAKLFDESNYKPWNDNDWIKKALSPKEIARVPVDFIINNYVDRAPFTTDKTIIPNYNLGKSKVGIFYNQCKESAPGGKKEKKTGVYREAAKLLKLEYKHWDNNLSKDKNISEEIPVNFIMKSYITRRPKTNDKTIIPNYNGGTSSVGQFYTHTLFAKTHGKTTGVHSKAAKLFDNSNYKPWHDYFEKKRLKSASKKKVVEKTKNLKSPVNIKTEEVVEELKIELKSPIKNNIKTEEVVEELKIELKSPVKNNIKTEEVVEELKVELKSPIKNNIKTEEVVEELKVELKSPIKNNIEKPKKGEKRKRDTTKQMLISKFISQTDFCTHKWKFINEDDNYVYNTCEKCNRNTKRNRNATQRGYKESNPEKKENINAWLSQQIYIPGQACILDSYGMKTTNSLVSKKRFRPDEIIVPEYDDKIYKENVQKEEYGMCLKKGDFLDNLKKLKINNVSLIYADFTGRYKTFVRPLFDYLEDKREADLIRKDMILGVTWSNNGIGNHTERSKIERNIGKFMYRNNFEPIDDSIVSESGYGIGANMNVQFMIKK